jgi:hypothetical protein
MPIFSEETQQDEVLLEIAKMSGLAQDTEEPVESEDLHEQEEAVAETDGGSDGEQGEGQGEEGQEEQVAAEAPEDNYKNLLEAYNLQAQQLLALQAQIGLAPSGGPPPATAPGPALHEVPPPVPSAAPFSPVIDKALVERALIEDDANAMEQVLVALVQQVVEHREAMRETILRDIPSVTQRVARQQLTMMKAVDDFYSKNEDLVPYQAIVGAVSNEIVAKEPQLSLDDALTKTEVEVRRRLGLKKQAIVNESRNKPAFAKTKSSRKPGQPQLSGLKADIAAMQAAKW